MKKKWKTLIAPGCILLVIAICAVWIVLQNTGRRPGGSAEIKVAEETVMVLPLDVDCRREISGMNGIKLIVVVENGSIFVESSQCPDKICVNYGKKNQVGDVIVCMPAKTVITILPPSGA